MSARTNPTLKPVHRAWIAGLAAIGLIGVAPVSLAQFTGDTACPHIGPLPVCHLVLMAYAAILLSVVRVGFWRLPLFLLAWLPIFGVAAAGSGLEVAGFDACPKSAGGWPKCYFSLLIACGLIVPVWLHRRSAD